jgi:hypothetical protein
MVPEAPLRTTKYGLVADVDGWFVVNAKEARWRDSGGFGRYCDFEGKRPFRQLGINVNVLEPGQSPASTTARTPRKTSSSLQDGASSSSRTRSGRSRRGTSFTARPGRRT